MRIRPGRIPRVNEVIDQNDVVIDVGDGRKVGFPGGHGETMMLKRKSAIIDIAATSISTVTATVTGWIPAGSLIMGVSGRVIATATGGTTTVAVGYTGATTAFAAAAAGLLTSGGSFESYTNGAATGPVLRAAATNLLFTAGGGTWTGGKYRITMWYFSLAAPTG